MADMIQQGLSWLAGQQKASCSETVVYMRGAAVVGPTNGSALQAVIGRTKFEIKDGFGERIEYSDLDFIFVAADLNLGGTPVVPQRGDTITYAGKKYEAHAPGKERVYKLDGFGLQVRVHTKWSG